MAKRLKEETVPELVEKIRERFDRWERIRRKGTTDPFWPDGMNMNLVRNHIFYYQDKLRGACKKERMKRCPIEAKRRPPRQYSREYMAPRSKAAKHYLWRKKPRKKG